MKPTKKIPYIMGAFIAAIVLHVVLLIVVNL